MMKEFGKTIGNRILLLLTGTVLGFVLLLAVYYLPTDSMEERMDAHVYQSLPMIEREFTQENLVEEYPASFVGGFTDCLMLHHAVYDSPEHSPLEQLLYMYRSESGTGDGWAAGYSLIDYLEHVPQAREEQYARYWHGYLVVLRPLLMLTNFNTIRILAAAVQLLLVGLIVAACDKAGRHKLGMAFLLAVPFLYYFSLYASLSLSICFYILAGALLFQVSNREKLEKSGRMGAYFMVVGMMTAYFDLLTYPLVTLGFPLCVYLYLQKESIKKQLFGIVRNSVEWMAGYGGLWVMKWVLMDCLMGSNIIADGFATISQRTESAEGVSALQGFVEVTKQNISAYTNWGYGLLTAGALVWLLYILIKRRKTVTGKRLGDAMMFLFVAVYPFVWFFCTQNHSEEHWIFTCKILSVTAFAGICGVLKLCGADDMQEEKYAGNK